MRLNPIWIAAVAPLLFVGAPAWAQDSGRAVIPEGVVVLGDGAAPPAKTPPLYAPVPAVGETKSEPRDWLGVQVKPLPAPAQPHDLRPFRSAPPQVDDPVAGIGCFPADAC